MRREVELRAVVEPTEPAPRDRAAKLLRLLEYSTQVGGSSDLEETLGLLLLSLMGEFATTGGTVLLLADGDQQSPQLRVAATRGVGSRNAETTFSLDAAASADSKDRAVSGPSSPALERIGRELGLELILELRHRGDLIGALGLAPRASGAPYSDDDRELVRLVAGIAATAVANHQLYRQLSTVNRQLERRLFDLDVVFDVSRELNGSLEPEGIYRVIVQTVMAHLLVSRCALLMVDDDPATPPTKLVFARGLRLDAEVETEVEQSAIDESVAILERGRPSPLLDLLATAGIEHLIPLTSGDGVRGLLAIGAKQDTSPLGAQDIAFLKTLGNQAVTALDNLRLHVDRARRERLERELSIARDIQRRLLPDEMPVIDGYDLAVESEPCFEIGGDYYDALTIPGGVLFAVGDVSGKSVPAALLMSVLQATVRSLAGRAGETPASLVTHLNRHLVRSTHASKFATFFLFTLEPTTGRIEYTNAGHNPPLLVRRDGRIERLDEGGPVLGVFDDVSFTQVETRLEPGDLLFVYTDGVTEAVDQQDDEFGEKRLERVLLEDRASDASAALARVIRAVADHICGVERGDDVTTLAIKRRED